MNIALCHESVLPERGGCETYIADLARRLSGDRHEVHLYACRRDETALPAAIRFHPIAAPRAPRFLQPWLFGRRCLRALAGQRHDLTVGFQKLWGSMYFIRRAGSIRHQPSKTSSSTGDG